MPTYDNGPLVCLDEAPVSEEPARAAGEQNLQPYGNEAAQEQLRQQNQCEQPSRAVPGPERVTTRAVNTSLNWDHVNPADSGIVPIRLAPQVDPATGEVRDTRSMSIRDVAWENLDYLTSQEFADLAGDGGHRVTPEDVDARIQQMRASGDADGATALQNRLLRCQSYAMADTLNPEAAADPAHHPGQAQPGASRYRRVEGEGTHCNSYAADYAAGMGVTLPLWLQDGEGHSPRTQNARAMNDWLRQASQCPPSEGPRWDMKTDGHGADAAWAQDQANSGHLVVMAARGVQDPQHPSQERSGHIATVLPESPVHPHAAQQNGDLVPVGTEAGDGTHMDTVAPLWGPEDSRVPWYDNNPLHREAAAYSTPVNDETRSRSIFATRQSTHQPE